MQDVLGFLKKRMPRVMPRICRRGDGSPRETGWSNGKHALSAGLWLSVVDET